MLLLADGPRLLGSAAARRMHAPAEKRGPDPTIYHIPYTLPPPSAEPAVRARTRRPEPEAEESRPPKRARFSDVQRAALEALAERAQWALPSLSREEKEAFCEQHGMTKARAGRGPAAGRG